MAQSKWSEDPQGRKGAHVISTDYVHHEKHGGNSFFVVYSVASLGAMTTPADTITLGFKTPDTTKWGNFTFGGIGTAGFRVRLIEAYSGGAATPTGQLAILNRNRNSTKTSTFTDGSTAAQVNYDATLATGGTTLWDQYLGGAGGPFGGAAGGGSSRDEIILKQNTVYQLSLFGTATDPATLIMGWYESGDSF